MIGVGIGIRIRIIYENGGENLCLVGCRKFVKSKSKSTFTSFLFLHCLSILNHCVALTMLSIIFFQCLFLILSFSQTLAFQQTPFLHRYQGIKKQPCPPLFNSLKPQLTKLINREDLTAFETEEAIDKILEGADSSVVGAFLALLRAKGETPTEMAGMVRAFKKACHPLPHTETDLLDIVGTGGDGADTINISTASVILAAAAGCKVAKAGNRSVSSQCGSADVLEALGIHLELTPEQTKQVLDASNIAFLFAPVYHPAMKLVAPIRKQLGIRTAFNLLGPLTNAANANRVVLGVFDEKLIDLFANILITLREVEHAIIVHGCGLDEISPLGSSTLYEIRNINPKKGIHEEKIYETKK
jgi:anthranilate phosphoribosyltransferase